MGKLRFVGICLTGVILALLSILYSAAQERLELVTEESISQSEAIDIVADYYSSLDAGAVNATADFFADDGAFGIIMLYPNGTKLMRYWEGKELIKTALADWFAARGDLVEPTRFDILAYQFPLLFVTGAVKYSIHEGYFTQAFIFQNGKFFRTGLVVHAGSTSPSTVSPPVAAVELLETIFQAADSGDITPILSSYTDSAKLCIGFRDEVSQSTSWQKAEDLTEIVNITEEYFALRNGQTQTEFTVAGFQYPLIFVEGIIRSADGTEDWSRFLGAYMIDDEDGEMKFSRSVVTLDWFRANDDEKIAT